MIDDATCILLKISSVYAHLCFLQRSLSGTADKLNMEQNVYYGI
jgi:hypothetical protein